jgi:hypothetical protein
MERDQDPPAGRGYGAVLSTPTSADIERARITHYRSWLAGHRGVPTDGSYQQLWQWSVAEPAGFWSSPRHVPDEMHQVPGAPRTLSGKKLEVPVRKILTGTPVGEAADSDSLANPEVPAYYLPGGAR